MGFCFFLKQQDGRAEKLQAWGKRNPSRKGAEGGGGEPGTQMP